MFDFFVKIEFKMLYLLIKHVMIHELWRFFKFKLYFTVLFQNAVFWKLMHTIMTGTWKELDDHQTLKWHGEDRQHTFLHCEKSAFTTWWYSRKRVFRNLICATHLCNVHLKGNHGNKLFGHCKIRQWY